MNQKKKLERIRAKNVARAPNYMKTAMIGERITRTPITGTFGPASEVVRIDPVTMQPIKDSQ